MDNLLTKCNADVFKAILDLKEENPEINDKLFELLQKYKYWWEIPAGDVMWFAAYLPHEIWNGKINTFYLLFESKQTTQNP